jgi:uncharacterized protein involved in exopolysaccharide biosynthesis
MRLKFALLDVSDTLRRRRRYLLLPFGGVFLLGIFVAYLLPEKYASFSTVIVQHNGSILPPEGSAAVDPLSLFREIVRSRYTLEAVAESLVAATPAASRPSLEEETVLLGNSITAEQRGADACRITAVHEDPETARKIAEIVTAVALRASGQSDRQQLDGAVRLAEEKLAHYEKSMAGRDPSPLSSGTSVPPDGAALRGALGRAVKEGQEAEAAVAAAERSLVLVRSSITSLDDPGTISRLASLENHAGAAFAGNIRTLATRYAELLTRYRPLHPEVQNVRRQLLGLLDRSAASLEAERDQAQTRTAELRVRQRQLRERIASLDSPGEGAAPVIPAPETAPGNMADLRHQLEQARSERDLNRQSGSRITILDRPQRPTSPVSPDRPFIICLAAAAGILIGIVTLVGAELLDTTIRRPGDLEVFGKPVIATLP